MFLRGQIALSCRVSSKCRRSQACREISARRDSGKFKSHTWMYLFSSQLHRCLWYLAWDKSLARVVVKGLGCWALRPLQRCWSSCGAGGKICCPPRLQKPLYTSSLWLWI